MKTAMLTIRIEPEVRDQIERSARTAGKSMSTFILDAVAKQHRIQAGVASFNTLYKTAAVGGAHGYDAVGHRLATMTTGKGRNFLQIHARSSDIKTVLKWFDLHYAKSMSLVPTRRRTQVAKGAIQVLTKGKRT